MSIIAIFQLIKNSAASFLLVVKLKFINSGDVPRYFYNFRNVKHRRDHTDMKKVFYNR